MQITKVPVKTDKESKLNRARLFWKTLAVIFFLTSIVFSVAYKTETYGRGMDAKVIRLETEKALRDAESNVKATSTPETTLTPTQPASLGKK